MASSGVEEWFQTYVFFIVLGLCLLLALIVTPIALVGIPSYFVYRLYRDSPKRMERLAREETMALVNQLNARTVRLTDEEIDEALSAYFPGRTPEVLRIQLLEIGREIFAGEALLPEIPPPPALLNTIEGARYRDMVARAAQAGVDRNMSLTALAIIGESLGVIARLAPPVAGELLVPITQFMEDKREVVTAVIAPFFNDTDYAHFKRLKDRLNANLAATNRSNPVLPQDYRGEDVIEAYLRGTVLERLFTVTTPFSIPEPVRFEHTHMIGGSGHGKTQTLQYHIARDLEDVARGEKSVVVIDSQGDLIRTILRAKTVDPERIVLIDPEDIDYPVCLNLFSVGQERLAGYEALEQERLSNSIIELYDFVLGSLLSAAMTQKQTVVFRYVTRLMFHIPDATIHTLRDLLEPGGEERYAEHIEKLEGSAKRFFETEFSGKEFTSTRQQVLRRLYGILENRTFERMFTHPRSKLDLFTEMNAGKLILIHTAKSLLKESGTEIFGRFFIALIAQAAQERATLPDWARMPTLVYVDEAQDYFDRNVGIILAQARKFRIGMVLAHQYLGQLEPKLQEAFEANTSIKMAGGVSARDARALAGQMSCEPDLIARQPKGTFATFVRGLTQRAVPIAFPFFVLEKREKASHEDMARIREINRERYAEPLRRAPEPEPDDEEERSGAFDEPATDGPQNDAATTEGEPVADEATSSSPGSHEHGREQTIEVETEPKRRKKRKPPKRDDPDTAPSDAW